MAVLTCTPSLPVDFPHRALVLETLARVKRTRTWIAYQADILGREVAEDLLRAAAFNALIAQDKSISPERMVSILEAFETAIGTHCCPA